MNPLANNEPETVGGGDRAVTGNLGLEESRAENVVEDKINPKQTKGLCKHGKTCTNKNICEYSHEHINKAEQRVETSTPMVFSNLNVNLNNVGLDDSEQHIEDLGPKLQGPNVCTKQEA